MLRLFTALLSDSLDYAVEHIPTLPLVSVLTLRRINIRHYHPAKESDVFFVPHPLRTALEQLLLFLSPRSVVQPRNDVFTRIALPVPLNSVPFLRLRSLECLSEFLPAPLVHP